MNFGSTASRSVGIYNEINNILIMLMLKFKLKPKTSPMIPITNNSVIDSPEREAYMGRTAFSLPSKLKFMPQSTLKWRLEEWLMKGCSDIQAKEESNEIKDLIGTKPVLIVAGENDLTLPSVEESFRLQTTMLERADVDVHVVNGAGHACTSGSRVDLAALMRKKFLSSSSSGRMAMKEVAALNDGVDFGLEPRYDGAQVGLSPMEYWSEALYRTFTCKTIQ